jgi:hypothetical protein
MSLLLDAHSADRHVLTLITINARPRDKQSPLSWTSSWVSYVGKQCESAVGFSAGVMMSTKVFVAGPHNVSTAPYEEIFDVQRIVSRGIRLLPVT